MSKRELKNYLKNLNSNQLRYQIEDLYLRFKNVKEFYDFAFNPNEKKLTDEIKFLISKEYFPMNTRRPKLRRSVAQKKIKYLRSLGADVLIISDIMFYNVEIAILYSAEVYVRNESFYLSIYKSFDEAVKYIYENGIQRDFSGRVSKIINSVNEHNWINSSAFERVLLQYQE